VPRGWPGKGRIWLWIRGSGPNCLVHPYKAKAFLDGKQVWDSGGWFYASCVQEVTELLTPGEHVLAVIAESTTPVGGVAASAWLEFVPEPSLRQSLAGEWGTGVRLPGKVTSPCTRSFVPDPAGKGKRAVFYVEVVTNNVRGIVLNGRILARETGGQHWRLDLTPFLRWGAPNEVRLDSQFTGEPMEVRTVEVRYED
jgi:hypothetical protein